MPVFVTYINRAWSYPTPFLTLFIQHRGRPISVASVCYRTLCESIRQPAVYLFSQQRTSRSPPNSQTNHTAVNSPLEAPLGPGAKELAPRGCLFAQALSVCSAESITSLHSSPQCITIPAACTTPSTTSAPCTTPSSDAIWLPSFC